LGVCDGCGAEVEDAELGLEVIDPLVQTYWKNWAGFASFWRAVAFVDRCLTGFISGIRSFANCLEQ